MALVIATRQGFHKKIREPGDKFNIDAPVDQIRKSKWLTLVNDPDEAEDNEASDAAGDADANEEDDGLLE